MADHVLLEAGDDLVRQLSHEREAVKAVLELVWNSLDADATKVDVTIERSGTTGVDKIVVADNGDGITPEKARTAFKQVGNSDKRVGGTTDRLQRPLHGKAGRGRLRAFALGDATRWTSTARAVDGQLMRTTIDSEISRRTTWRIDTQPVPGTDSPGSIDHNPSLEQALAYLRHRHGDLLPDQLRQSAAVPTPRSGAAHNPAV
ncbi:ATP-binding protein [Streptomyces sp. R11]|uniref:ATP-binding protein n=1 Tax=Streptomyces sp. R11 TaxID=3238625 RepID=A0AB39NBQ4_9ACTN